MTPNKLLSKIASELEKPGGVTVLRMEDVPTRIWPLPARKINGIGPKAGAKLEALGIRTIGELAQADPALLIAQFGKGYGPWMHEAAHGRDDHAIVTHSEPKSISRETTFEEACTRCTTASGSRAFSTRPVREAGRGSRAQGLPRQDDRLKLRYDNFKR